eukprot:GHUV01053995.1.p1 GENE.GHUV01053995.1~~GHUV01053995.1.p1  ORF type:complete len:149 (+),score=38.27 GHUV01053995.1:794-1240(+)
MDVRLRNVLLDKPFSFSAMAGAKDLRLESDNLTWQGFKATARMLLIPSGITAAEVKQAATRVTGVYTEKNLQRANIRLTGFDKAVLYKQPGQPLSNNTCYNRHVVCSGDTCDRESARGDCTGQPVQPPEIALSVAIGVGAWAADHRFC